MKGSETMELGSFWDNGIIKFPGRWQKILDK